MIQTVWENNNRQPALSGLKLVIDNEFERIKTIKNKCGLNEYIDILPSRTAKKICKFMSKPIVMK